MLLLIRKLLDYFLLLDKIAGAAGGGVGANAY
jgi:hypothetical protein